MKRNPTTVNVPADRVASDPAQLRWGTVSTIRAPLRDITRFAAHHLDLGAAEVHIFLDDPDPEITAFLSRRREVFVTQCNAAYWSGKPEQARKTHQMRQAFNASRCYRRSRLDWLAHIDVDEFLLSSKPIPDQLVNAPKDAAFAVMLPAELLAQTDPWSGPSHFKLTRRELGHARDVLDEIYPEIGFYVPDGFLSHTDGKILARTGLPDIRFGIHSLLQFGARVSNGHMLQGTHVGHAHAPSWEVFLKHFDFRMQHGSYRSGARSKVRLTDIFQLALEDGGTDGLRAVYYKMCAATPTLLQRLSDHGMLLTETLNLDQKVSDWFGDLPGN